MPFASTDPRARLTSLGGDTPAASAYGDASYAKFYETAPQIALDAEHTWVVRGANFVVAYSQVSAGARLHRHEQPDEYFLLLPDPDARIRAETDTESVDLSGNSVVIMPPGESTLVCETATVLARFFTARSQDLLAIASNAETYFEPAPNVEPLVEHPEPPDGYRVRSYSLDVPASEGRFGRIWRPRSLMVNYSAPRPGPRAVTKMTPHSHADFEQGSLCLSGTFVHHLRWPWSTDQRLWREDTHEICAGPSVAVIPPLVLHTSQECGTGINQLVDLFAPPRADFSAQEGWVLNADEYPEAEA